MTKRLLIILILALTLALIGSNVKFAFASSKTLRDGLVKHVNMVDIDSPNAVAEYASKAGVSKAEAAEFIASLRRDSSKRNSENGDIGTMGIGGHTGSFVPICRRPPHVTAYARYWTGAGPHTVQFLTEDNLVAAVGGAVCANSCNYVAWTSITPDDEIAWYVVLMGNPTAMSFHTSAWCVALS